jgi:excisionase family DNA binding protein
MSGVRMSQVGVEAVGDRITIQEAARRLGVKDDAIRKRIQRGTLRHEKDPDGRVYVFLDATHDMSQAASYDNVHRTTESLSKDSVTDTSQDTLVAILQDQIRYLRDIIETRDRELEARTEELRRKDTIIMSLAQRVPELTTSSSPEDLTTSDELVRSSEREEDKQPTRRSQADTKRPWWRTLIVRLKKDKRDEKCRVSSPND